MKVRAGGLKEPTPEFLDLIDQEGEHRQASKDGGQMLLPVTVVVFEFIALVLERIEGFVFDFPASASSSHQRFNILWRQFDIGDPAEPPLAITILFPVFQKIDPPLRMGFVQGQIVHPEIAVLDPVRIGKHPFLRVARVALLLHGGKQDFMVAGLNRNTVQWPITMACSKGFVG